MMSMDAITPPTSATSVPDAANVVDDSSDDEEQSYNLEEGILDFYVGKAKFTVANYSNRIKQFRNWYRELYGRELDSKPCLKIKHVRLFFQEKSKTCRQMRALVVVIKGLLRHLYKIKVLKKSKVSDNENYDSNKFNFIISYQNQLLNASRSNLDNSVYQAVKQKADIEDNRSLYY